MKFLNLRAMCRASESGVAAHGILPTGWSEDVSWGVGWGLVLVFGGNFGNSLKVFLWGGVEG